VRPRGGQPQPAPLASIERKVGWWREKWVGNLLMRVGLKERRSRVGLEEEGGKGIEGESLRVFFILWIF
jgi:hypothetical protein